MILQYCSPLYSIFLCSSLKQDIICYLYGKILPVLTTLLYNVWKVIWEQYAYYGAYDISFWYK
jgi:hypothetical protein